jgi:hypothetical protein
MWRMSTANLAKNEDEGRVKFVAITSPRKIISPSGNQKRFWRNPERRAGRWRSMVL